MTSFGTSLPMLDSTVFMPTFRIQGQVYHKPLMSLPNEEAKLLQKYFLETKKLKRNLARLARWTHSLQRSPVLGTRLLRGATLE
ncbi:hypothetical protein AVEN_113582-1 [Araneus ventricosus]|uniref:Uncharacterized protein n=1 Tax=Araneus ventricosus TaxID=182803 RepID=A0A4Y2WJR8_ARAVE|nr:hypothetical protein AVEN_113582-1 [Araneus ventricosus]